jgi:Zn2+/Cd2+-exporting ATPase
MTALPMAGPADPGSAPARFGPDAQRFRVDGMDCASCAQTVRKVVAGLDGVEAVDVSFGNATMLVAGRATPEAIEAAVTRAGFGARLAGRPRAPQAPFWRRSRRSASTCASVVLLLAAVVVSLLPGGPDGAADGLFLSSMAVGGWPILLSAATAVRRGSLDMTVLMSLAAIGAVAIGDFAEAAWVLVLFAVGTTLETFAMDRSRRSVEQLMDLAPPEARVLEGDAERTVPVDEVLVGQHVFVRPGERIPLDGTVVAGRSSVDESALTGESVPADKEQGGRVFAGTLNAQGALTVAVTAPARDSTLARVAQLVADAQGSKAPSERFVDRFARWYTPLVVLTAALVAVVPTLAGGDFDTWLYRALALLIVACPCALVISVPVSVVSAIGGAARRGVLVKSGQALEDLGRVRAVALDKTGTLTRGRPALVDVVPGDGLSGGDALRLMASVERSSEHPLAQAILRAAQDRGVTPPAAEDFEALPGRGAVATVGGRHLWAGGPRLAADRGADVPAALGELESAGRTTVLLGEGPRVLAVFGLADELRPEAASAVGRLREQGLEVTMLTGDNARVAAAVAQEAGVTSWRAGLLPEDKLLAVGELRNRHGATAMVGDGVNDAPALAGADVGVAMGAAGSDIALESADLALMGDELDRLPEAVEHSRRALRIMRQNVVVSLATKAVFVALAPLGFVSLVVAVAADMGVSLLVTLNGLRLLRTQGDEPTAAPTPTCCAPKEAA